MTVPIRRLYAPDVLLGPRYVIKSVLYNTPIGSTAHIKTMLHNKILGSTVCIKNTVLGSTARAINTVLVYLNSIVLGPNSKARDKNALLYSPGNIGGNVLKIG